MSVLLESTLLAIRGHREHPAYDAEKYARGPLHVWLRTDGRFVILDHRRAWSDRRVGLETTLEDAATALDRIADAEGIRWNEEPAGPPLYGRPVVGGGAR